MSDPVVEKWMSAGEVARTKQLMVPFRNGGIYELEFLVGKTTTRASVPQGHLVQLLTVEGDGSGQYETVFLYDGKQGWRALLRFGVRAADRTFDLDAALRGIGETEPEIEYDIVEGGKYA